MINSKGFDVGRTSKMMSIAIGIPTRAIRTTYLTAPYQFYMCLICVSKRFAQLCHNNTIVDDDRVNVSRLTFFKHVSIWPLPLEREPKNQPSLPKMLSLRPSLVCQWTLFSRFVKFIKIHSAFNLQLELRYLDIWIPWTSCDLLGLPRPCELFS